MKKMCCQTSLQDGQVKNHLYLILHLVGLAKEDMRADALIVRHIAQVIAMMNAKEHVQADAAVMDAHRIVGTVVMIVVNTPVMALVIIPPNGNTPYHFD